MCGMESLPTASVVLKGPDGVARRAAAIGTGPVDAAYKVDGRRACGRRGSTLCPSRRSGALGPRSPPFLPLLFTHLAAPSASAPVQAIAWLSPVQCRLLDYNVSAITEVGGWVAGWLAGWVDTGVALLPRAWCSPPRAQPAACASVPSCALPAARFCPAARFACCPTSCSAHLTPPARLTPPSLLQGIDALVQTRVVIEPEEQLLSDDEEGLVPQVPQVR